MATLVSGPRQRQLKYRFYKYVVFTDGQIHALSVFSKDTQIYLKAFVPENCLEVFLIILKYSFFLQSFNCSATSWRMYGLGGIIAKSCFVLIQAVGYRHAQKCVLYNVHVIMIQRKGYVSVKLLDISSSNETYLQTVYIFQKLNILDLGIVLQKRTCCKKCFRRKFE